MLAILMNLVAATFSLMGTILALADRGAITFKYYTTDSNLLSMFACLLLAFFQIRRKKSGKEIPRAALLFKYVCACCLTVTFLVVLFILSPSEGANGFQKMLLEGDMLFHHLLCPITTVISLFLFDRTDERIRKTAAWGILPTLLYAAILIPLNIAHITEGPYPFLCVYRQPWWMSCLWFVLIIGGAYGISLLLARCIHKRP